MSTKQRRGKKEADDGTDDPSVPLEEQIARAQATVLRGEEQASQLHKQWRNYLLRLSYLLVIITMHQIQGPTGACIRDVKAFNKVASEDERISGLGVFGLVIADTVPYIFALIIAGSLSFFLVIEEAGTFANPRYMLANALLPPMVGMFFMTKDKPSCLDEDKLVRADVDESRTRSLPVVVVFHLIVTVCYWFMDRQRQQQANNKQMIEELRQDLVQARKGGTNTVSSRKPNKKKN